MASSSNEEDDWEAAVAAVPKMMDQDRSLDDEHLEPGAVVLSLSEVSYDRDVKWVNVPVKQLRSGGKCDALRIRKGHGLVRDINKITGSNLDELHSLDRHYQSLDDRKAAFDASLGPSRRSGNRRREVRRAPGNNTTAAWAAKGLQPPNAGNVQLLCRPPVPAIDRGASLRAEAPVFVPSWERR